MSFDPKNKIFSVSQNTTGESEQQQMNLVWPYSVKCVGKPFLVDTAGEMALHPSYPLPFALFSFPSV